MYLSGLSEKTLSVAEVAHVVEPVVATILELCNPQKIILFGSSARGTSRASSDLDLCLVFATPAEMEWARKKILCRPPLSSTPIDYLFYDVATFKAKLDRGGVCELIAGEGVVLFSEGVKRSIMVAP